MDDDVGQMTSHSKVARSSYFVEIFKDFFADRQIYLTEDASNMIFPLRSWI